MVGANYMGGKRNAVRAKTKDAAGRAQKRHFVKQRLANALGHRSPGDRRNSGPLRSASLLSEISLAHAPHNTRRSPHVPLNQYYTLSSDNENGRKRPSKVLSALDTSDHMSIRAAIDRILQLPDLVGAQAVTHKDTVPCGGARTANDSSDEYGTNDQDSPFDTEHLQRPENNNTDEGMASRNFRDSGYTERRNSKAPFSTQGPLCAQSNQFSPLPRSSPFTTDSSFMDVDRDMILEFESSPRPPPSPITEWSNEQSMMFGHYLPATQHMHPSKDSGHGSDLGHFQPLSRISTSSDKFSGSKIHSSPELSLSFLSHQPTFRGLEFSDSPDRVRCIHETQPVKDNSDIVPMTHLPLDFLSDPDPWATIGRILQVERLKVASDVTSSSECPIDFTKGREGVGYSVKTGRDVTSSMFTGAVSDSSLKETAVGSNQYFGDNDCSLSRTASRFGSAHKPLEDALAHDLNTFDDDVKLSSRLRRWPPYLEKNGPTEGDGARMMGGHLLTELECRTSDAFPEKNAAMVYDGPCLFGDSDSEDD